MHFDSSDNPVFINEQIHKNAQATTVLLASLCKDEYNKVSGVEGLPLPKVLKNLTNMFPSITYCHRRLLL
jgi:hypothetical protein